MAVGRSEYSSGLMWFGYVSRQGVASVNGVLGLGIAWFWWPVKVSCEVVGTLQQNSSIVMT